MKHSELPKIERIRFESLSFTHENHDPILNNVDFEFPNHCIVRFKSPEGAGKSTLLQVLAGLLIPQSGCYFLNEENVVQMSFEDFLPYRLGIGYTFDYGGLINNRTIFDNLMLPLLYHKFYSSKEAKQYVEALLKKFEISKFMNERPAHVPGRVRKLACLLRALVIQPQMLLMDDPSVGLGLDTIFLFVDYIHEMRKQGTLKHIFISSYDDKFMSHFDHKVVFIDKGSIYLHQEDTEKKVANI